MAKNWTCEIVLECYRTVLVNRKVNGLNSFARVSIFVHLALVGEECDAPHFVPRYSTRISRHSAHRIFWEWHIVPTRTVFHLLWTLVHLTVGVACVNGGFPVLHRQINIWNGRDFLQTRAVSHCDSDWFSRWGRDIPVGWLRKELH